VVRLGLRLGLETKTGLPIDYIPAVTAENNEKSGTIEKNLHLKDHEDNNNDIKNRDRDLSIDPNDNESEGGVKVDVQDGVDVSLEDTAETDTKLQLRKLTMVSQ
jgi:hypothetical protein